MPEKLSEKLAEPERGRAMNCRMVERKILKPVAEEDGMPWISWHALRRSFATIADQLNWTVADRIASMGHGQFRTTLMYTQADVERRRTSAEEMAEKLNVGEKLVEGAKAEAA